MRQYIGGISMQLNSDLTMFHPLWERADNELCSSKSLGIFGRLVDVYVLACAIGIKEDKVITEIEAPLSNEKTIGRNTHRQNLDIRDLLDFMLQNALINSNTIDFDTDERLKLAFNPDYTVKNFSAANFLTGFANYGIVQIFNAIQSKSPIVAINELYRYFESLASSRYDELLQNITLETLMSEN